MNSASFSLTANQKVHHPRDVENQQPVIREGSFHSLLSFMGTNRVVPTPWEIFSSSPSQQSPTNSARQLPSLLTTSRNELLKTLESKDFSEVIRHEVNYCYEFIDVNLQQEFKEFLNHFGKGRSGDFLILTLLIVTFLLFPQVVCQLIFTINGYYRLYPSSTNASISYALAFLSFFCVTGCYLIGWILFFQDRISSCACIQCLIDTSKPRSIHQASSSSTAEIPATEEIPRKKLSKGQLLDILNAVFMLLLQFFFVFEFLKLVFNLNCFNSEEHLDKVQSYGSGVVYVMINMFGNDSCVPDSDRAHKIGFLNAHSIQLFILPFIFFKGLPQTPFKLIWVNYIIAVITFFGAIISVSAYDSLPTGIIWMLITFFSIQDFQVRNMIIFLSTRNVKETMVSRDKAMEENHANEMRSLIANVAHDLKTVSNYGILESCWIYSFFQQPLASFTTGVDYIQIAMDEFEATLAPSIQSPGRQLVDTVQQCLVNIRNTNAFMLMTINRCIDYTKVTKGLKLKPHLETIDIMETIQLPLQCMRNIQSKMQIVVAPPTGKTICSHVITDKLWLQENLLCLLSNAVKYSNDGIITISLRLQSIHHHAGEMDDKSEEQDSSQPSNSHANVSHTLDGRPNMAELVRSLSQSSNSSSNAAIHGGATQNMLVVEVEDTGIGMTDEAMKILFNPFNQTQRLAGGTGLGLFSLAKRVEALHGKYGVRRRRDGRQGSLFWFAVPYRPDHFMAEVYAKEGQSFRSALSVEVKGEQSAKDRVAFKRTNLPNHSPGTETILQLSNESLVPLTVFRSMPSGKKFIEDVHISTDASLRTTIRETISPSSSIATEPSRSEQSLHILVVDDSPSIMKMATMMLKKLGHLVVGAENGQIAVNTFRDTLHKDCPTKRFDIIIMDLQMPVMDGLEAISRIRDMEKSVKHCLPPGSLFKPAWIVGCSANSDLETEEAAIRAGATTFMTKPYNVTTLCSVIAEATL